jgi:hypothetical protein
MTLENTDSKASTSKINIDIPATSGITDMDELSKPVWFEKIIEKLSKLKD